MSTDLVGVLSDLGIRLKSVRPGHNERLRCPKCEGGRTKELCLSVTIDEDGAGAVLVCHRGSCGWRQGVRTGPSDDRRPVQRRPVEPPQPPPEHTETDIKKPPSLYAFFAQRGIGAETVDAFGCYTTPHWFPDKDGKQPALVFPYRFGGKIVNRKYRSPNKMFMQEKNHLPTLFNIDAITSPDVVWICEGEADVMAMHEAGYPQTVTLANGAPADLRDEDDPARETDKRFAPLATHAELLGKVGKFILCGDMDRPGEVLREEFARRFGRHRCSIVTWPEGCKDACDTLRIHGAEGVQQAVERAEKYPIEGFQGVKIGTLLALRRGAPPATMTTGVTSLDRDLHIPTEGRLIIVTGVPSHGKALALDTPVPTPTGWTTMGGLKTGDEVFSADGTVTKVQMAHSVLHGRECYRIVMDDGSHFICDAEHLWFTRDDKARRSATSNRLKRGKREETKPRGKDQRHLRTFPSAKTARDIASTIYAYPGTSYQRLNHAIAVTEPLSLDVSWPSAIKPYTLGAWLGDGTSSSGGFTSADNEMAANIRAEGYEVRKKNYDTLAWTIIGIAVLLRSEGILNNKHIPAACLRSSAADRLSLLQGLLDTDGHYGADGTVEFCTIKSELANNVAELVASLGMKPKIYQGRATLDGRDCGPKFRVCFIATMQVFRLERKKSPLHPKTKARGSKSGYRFVVSCELVASVPVRCITVEHSSSLYLVGKAMVPTHNTSLVRFLSVHLMRTYQRKFLVFSPEMTPWEHYVSSCAEVWCGKRFWGAPGPVTMTEDEISAAEDWFRTKLVMLVADSEDASPTLQWLLDMGKISVLRDGTTDLVIDPWNEIEHDRAGLTEAEYISRGLQRLKGFAARYGVNVWVIVHPVKMLPPKPGAKIEAPQMYDISGGAMWANKADLGLVVHTPETSTQVIIRKARFSRWGKRNATVELTFDPVSGRYASAGIMDEMDDLSKRWND